MEARSSILRVEESIPVRAGSSLFAQQYHRIHRQCASRWNPRSQKSQQRHRYNNGCQYQWIAGGGLIYDEGQHPARQESEE
jgi:hypothetical protein